MNKKTANILFVGLIIAVILFMIWILFWLKSESSDCVRNPINYFKEKNPEISCSCYKNGKIIKELSDEIEYNIQP